MSKVLLIGALNLTGCPNGGEEFKNRVLSQYLNAYYKLTIVDTHSWRTRPDILVNLFWHLLFRDFDLIVISASSLSSFRLIRFLNIFPSLLRKSVYFVIGGFFPDGVKSGRYPMDYYLGLKSIVVEGVKLKNDLSNVGLSKNVRVVPNFKYIPSILSENFRIRRNELRFVFLSSISAEKGVDLIFEAVQHLHSSIPGRFKIEFWGPIEDSYQDRFKLFLLRNPTYCTYRGYLNLLSDPDEAYTILSSYDCLLFPTFYIGEGFPGVIIDAYIAGLPVIASDWNMNSEIVHNEVTGIVIPPKDSKSLSDAMRVICCSPEILSIMREECLKEAQKFDVESVLNGVFQKLLKGD